MKYNFIALLCFIIIALSSYGCDSDEESLTSLNPSIDAGISIANNEPRLGSVIQGSRGNGVTQDTVAVTVNNDDSISVEITDGNTTLTCDAGRCSSSSARAEMFSRFNVNGEPEFDITGRVVFGIWNYNDIWGMVVDGLTESETSVSDIPNVETCYEGNAVVYYTVSEGGETSDQRRLEGVAELTLAGDGSITGLITGIEGIPDSTTVTVTLALAEAGSGAEELLYSGATSIADIPGTNADATGNWGVQFFGSNGGYLAGTWGGQFGNDITVNEGEEGSAVGILFATREASCSTSN